MLKWKIALVAATFAATVLLNISHAAAAATINDTAILLPPPPSDGEPGARFDSGDSDEWERQPPRDPMSRGRGNRDPQRGGRGADRGGHAMDRAIMEAVRDVVGELTPEQHARLESRLRELTQGEMPRPRHHRMGPPDDRRRPGFRGDDGERGFGFHRRGGQGGGPGAATGCCENCNCPRRSDGPPPPKAGSGRAGPSSEDAAASARPPRRDGGRDGARGRGPARNDGPRRGEGRRQAGRFFDRFDSNDDGAVTREEFPGRSERFDKLDGNDDDRIDKEDLKDRARQRREAPRPRDRDTDKDAR